MSSGVAPGVEIGGSRQLSVVALAAAGVRVLLGVLFLFSGATKLQNPQLFGFALKAFHLGLGPEILMPLAFVIPWCEVVIGSLLVLGFKTRPSAALVVAMMLAFIAGIASLMWRGLDVDCPCFGGLQMACTGPLGTCHLVRNGIIAAVAAMIAARGGGSLSVDAALGARRGRG